MIEIIDIKLYHYIEYFILHITHFVDILYRCSINVVSTEKMGKSVY